MWAKNIPLGAVQAIAGRKQFMVTLTGQANHAGSTPMTYRRDALVAAAAVITGVREMAMKMSANTVATVGRIEVEPNAINVVPGAVRLTVDLRSADPNRLQAGQKWIDSLVSDCGVESRCTVTEDQPPVAMHQHVVEQLVQNGAPHRTISGALHDAAILAPHLPTAMLFVASKDGISHNPAEFSRIEDIAAAAAVLEKVVSTS
jgi:allantoate deiminase